MTIEKAKLEINLRTVKFRDKKGPLPLSDNKQQVDKEEIRNNLVDDNLAVISGVSDLEFEVEEEEEE